MHASAQSKPDQVPLAWAGWLLRVPPSARLIRVVGGARKGSLALGDDLGPRLELAWADVTKRRFDARRQLERKLIASLPRQERQRAQIHVEAGSHLNPLLRYEDVAERCQRWIGFAPATRRAIEIVYRQRDPTTDAIYRDAVIRLQDQSTQQPHRWAFFGHRLITPAGYELHDATLNLGNMEIRLARRRRWGDHHLSIRLIYPAALALQRDALEHWLTRLMRVRRSLYLPRYAGWLRRGNVRHTTQSTSLGPALVCEASMPFVLRLVRITTPAHQRSWLIHDADHDRLIFIQAQTDRDVLNDLARQVVAGMHWQNHSTGTPHG